MEIINEYPDKDWDWGLISQHPNITIEDIHNNPEKHWCWWFISQNQNITMAIINKYPNHPWNWSILSVGDIITLEDIENNPDKPWDWNSISRNNFTNHKECFELRVNKQKFTQDHLFESVVKKAYHPERMQRLLNKLEEEDPDRDNIEYMEECLL